MVRKGGTMGLTHVDRSGKATMVDVGAKDVTSRKAVARARVLMKKTTLELIRNNEVKKGDVLGVARVAGIMAAKKTSSLIPLCHPLNIDHVSVEFSLSDDPSAVEITTSASISSKTGVEMEALTAAAVAALTIYDMCKAADREMTITDIMLVEKRGGKSGTFVRK